MEGDAGEGEADDHARGGPDHDPAAADDVDVLECNEGEDEVGTRDDEADRGRLVEPDLLEERGWFGHASIRGYEQLNGSGIVCSPL